MSQRVSTAVLSACIWLAAVAATPTLAAPRAHHAAAHKPQSALAVPPASAEDFVIVSSGGTHGHSRRWVTGDGRHMSRETFNLRGQLFDIEETQLFDANGMPSTLRVRGTTPSGDATESFRVAKGQAAWKSPVDTGHAAYAVPAFYVSYGGTSVANGDFFEALLKAPGRSLNLLPGGKAHAEKLTELSVGDGGLKKTVVAYAITGIGNSPFAVWMTQDGKFFANAGGISVLPKGYEAAMNPLIAAQTEALSQQAPAIAHRFLKAPETPVAFSHVETYDAEHETFLKDQTVVVEGGKITAAGPADSVTVPADARIIPGAGMTLVPGLWDSHQHVGDDFSGPMLLSLGITSGRDPGNN
ncbi:MAG: hypothetical protein ACXU8U_11095, partial [Asticcacaulis sp.]